MQCVSKYSKEEGEARKGKGRKGKGSCMIGGSVGRLVGCEGMSEGGYEGYTVATLMCTDGGGVRGRLLVELDLGWRVRQAGR